VNAGHTTVQLQAHTTDPDWLARTAAEYRQRLEERTQQHFEAARGDWLRDSLAARELAALETRHGELQQLAEAAAGAAAKAARSYQDSLIKGMPSQTVKCLQVRDRTAAESSAAAAAVKDLEGRLAESRAVAGRQLQQHIRTAAGALVRQAFAERAALVEQLGKPLLAAAVDLALLTTLCQYLSGLPEVSVPAGSVPYPLAPWSELPQ
jgi:hypothetical protein